MVAYTDRFGGSTIQPVDAGYLAVALTASYVSQWPWIATDPTVVLAKVMNVTPNQAGLSITMPDATLSGTGAQVIFFNSGSYPFTVFAHDGVTPIATVEAGGRRLLIQADNSTTNGSWIVTLLGVGTGSLDVAAAAGLGLQAQGTTLQVAFPVVPTATPRTLVAADRDTVIVWTGGAGTLVLPLSGTFAAFNCEIRNQGTGALVVTNTGGELLDGSASNTFNIGESAWVHAGSGSWYTVGRGRNALFNFTELQKTIAGGTTTLTLTEAANVVQVYNGALTSNATVVLPAVVQVYYLSNQTTGAFSLTFRNPATGTTLSLPQGQNAVVFSDGTNIVNAATTTAGVAQVNYGAGTVSAPSVSIGATNTGLFSPSSGQLAMSLLGVQALLVTAAGTVATATGNVSVGASSTTGTALAVLSRAAGQVGGVQVSSGANTRWVFGASGDAESGSNNGSNFFITRYSDAGTAIDTPLSINRATGQVVVTSLEDVSAVGQVVFYAGPASVRPGYLELNGALVSRTTYAALFAYASIQGLLSEATWAASNWGGFSVGDGSTTFRVPDLRGMFIRGLDDGRGIDTSRVWYSGQAPNLAAHNHVVNISDPGHNHAHSDPGHAHSVNDPGHAHGISDPTHAHSYTATVANGGNFATGFPNQAYAPTGAATAGSGTGIAVAGAFTGIGIFAAVTGISNVATTTGITGSSNNTGTGTDTRPYNVAYPAYIRT